MKGKKSRIADLIVSLISATGLFLILNFFEPQKPFVLWNFTIYPILLFFSLLFITIAGGFSFILKSKRRGILVASFVSLFFLLQYLRFNNIFYTILLLLIIILIEILFWKKKQ